MVLIIGSFLFYSVVFICVLVYLFYWYQTRYFGYWRQNGVPYLEPSWFFGSLKDVILRKISWYDFALKCYAEFKTFGVGGIYFMRYPAVVVCDPCLIEKILVTDFVYFHDKWKLNEHDALSQALSHGTGDRWRILRLRLATMFSSSKVKGMFGQIFRCANYTLNTIEQSVKVKQSVEVEPLTFLFATETIASCAFGIELLSDSTTGKHFKNAIGLLFNSSPLRITKCVLCAVFPKVTHFFGLKVTPDKVFDFFLSLTKGIWEYRQKHQLVRNDFLQMMTILKDQEDGGKYICNSEFPEDQTQGVSLDHKLVSGDKIFTESAIAALMLNYLASGVKPTEVTLNFALFEIARNGRVQQALHEEIDLALKKHNGWKYETIRDMTYLDQVIQETLRIYTFNPLIVRSVTQPYTVSGTNLVLPKDMIVYIPVAAIHMDPQHHPSPETFDPDRFQGNNYKSTSSYMPFGAGPRICISVRLAVTMMKICLARILSVYSVAVDESRMRLPVVFDKYQMFPKAKGGVWLVFDERNDL